MSSASASSISSANSSSSTSTSSSTSARDTSHLAKLSLPNILVAAVGKEAVRAREVPKLNGF